MRPPFRRPYSGLSLAGLLVALGVVGLVAGILLVAAGSMRGRAHDRRVEADAARLNHALGVYVLTGGSVPAAATPDELLAVLQRLPDDRLSRETLAVRMLAAPGHRLEAYGIDDGRARLVASGGRFAIARSGEGFVLVSGSAGAPEVESRTLAGARFSDSAPWVWDYAAATAPPRVAAPEGWTVTVRTEPGAGGRPRGGGVGLSAGAQVSVGVDLLAGWEVEDAAISGAGASLAAGTADNDRMATLGTGDAVVLFRLRTVPTGPPRILGFTAENRLVPSAVLRAEPARIAGPAWVTLSWSSTHLSSAELRGPGVAFDATDGTETVFLDRSTAFTLTGVPRTLVVLRWTLEGADSFELVDGRGVALVNGGSEVLVDKPGRYTLRARNRAGSVEASLEVPAPAHVTATAAVERTAASGGSGWLLAQPREGDPAVRIDVNPRVVTVGEPFEVTWWSRSAENVAVAGDGGVSSNSPAGSHPGVAAGVGDYTFRIRGTARSPGWDLDYAARAVEAVRVYRSTDPVGAVEAEEILPATTTLYGTTGVSVPGFYVLEGRVGGAVERLAVVEVQRGLADLGHEVTLTANGLGAAVNSLTLNMEPTAFVPVDAQGIAHGTWREVFYGLESTGPHAAAWNWEATLAGQTVVAEVSLVRHGLRATDTVAVTYGTRAPPAWVPGFRVVVEIDDPAGGTTWGGGSGFEAGRRVPVGVNLQPGWSLAGPPELDGTGASLEGLEGEPFRTVVVGTGDARVRFHVRPPGPPPAEAVSLLVLVHPSAGGTGIGTTTGAAPGSVHAARANLTAGWTIRSVTLTGPGASMDPSTGAQNERQVTLGRSNATLLYAVDPPPVRFPLSVILSDPSAGRTTGSAADVATGDRRPVSAVLDPGWSLAGVALTGRGASIDPPASAPGLSHVVTMGDGPAVVVFQVVRVAPRHQLRVRLEPAVAGAVVGDADGLLPGEQRTVSAFLLPGWEIIGATVAGPGATMTPPTGTDASRVVTLGDGDAEVVFSARATSPSLDLVVRILPSHAGAAIGGRAGVTPGSRHDVTAVLNAGWELSDVRLEGSGAAMSPAAGLEPNRSVTIGSSSAVVTFTARQVPGSWRLEVRLSDPAAGTTSGSATGLRTGERRSVTATLLPGWSVTAVTLSGDGATMSPPGPSVSPLEREVVIGAGDVVVTYHVSPAALEPTGGSIALDVRVEPAAAGTGLGSRAGLSPGAAVDVSADLRRGEGWELVRVEFDDGGNGGHMDPADGLQIPRRVTMGQASASVVYQARPNSVGAGKRLVVRVEPGSGGIPHGSRTGVAPGMSVPVGVTLNPGRELVRAEVTTGDGTLDGAPPASPDREFTMGMLDAEVTFFTRLSGVGHALDVLVDPAAAGSGIGSARGLSEGSMAEVSVAPAAGWEIATVDFNGAGTMNPPVGGIVNQRTVIMGRGDATVWYRMRGTPAYELSVEVDPPEGGQPMIDGDSSRSRLAGLAPGATHEVGLVLNQQYTLSGAELIGVGTLGGSEGDTRRPATIGTGDARVVFRTTRPVYTLSFEYDDSSRFDQPVPERVAYRVPLTWPVAVRCLPGAVFTGAEIVSGAGARITELNPARGTFEVLTSHSDTHVRIKSRPKRSPPATWTATATGGTGVYPYITISINGKGTTSSRGAETASDSPIVSLAMPAGALEPGEYEVFASVRDSSGQTVDTLKKVEVADVP